MFANLLRMMCTVSVGLIMGVAATAQEPTIPAYPYELIPEAAIREHLVQGEFREPMGLWFDFLHGELLIADSKNDLVGIFDPDGIEVFAFGGQRVMQGPQRLAIGADDRVYVQNSEREHLMVFNYRGELLEKRSFFYPNPDGEGELQVMILVFTIDAEGNFYLADQARPQVLVYDKNHLFVRAIRPQRAGARLSIVTGLAVSPSGLLAVTDFKETPVQIFDRDGRFVRGFGGRDIGPEHFSAPMAVAFDGESYLYVVDMLRHEVKIFDVEGNYQGMFGGWFGPGTGGRLPGEMLYPFDVAVGPDDRLYVSERFGQRVQIFKKAPREESRPRLRIPNIPTIDRGERKKR